MLTQCQLQTPAKWAQLSLMTHLSQSSRLSLIWSHWRTKISTFRLDSAMWLWETRILVYHLPLIWQKNALTHSLNRLWSAKLPQLQLYGEQTKTCNSENRTWVRWFRNLMRPKLRHRCLRLKHLGWWVWTSHHLLGSLNWLKCKPKKSDQNVPSGRRSR